MGAGATSGVQAVIDELSCAELNETLSKVGFKDRVAFWDTVGENNVQAAIDGNAEVKAAFEKVAEGDRQKFIDAVTKVKSDATAGAPYLELAFAHTIEWYNVQEKEQDPSPEMKKKFADVFEAYFESDLKPVYEKSFKRHDTSNNGVLEPDEAKVYFANLVPIILRGLPNYLRSRAAMIAATILGEGTHDDAANAAMTKKVEESVPLVCNAIAAAYKDNKDEMDAAAFKTLDSNEDGTLQFTEFLKTVQSESETKNKFYEALGLGKAEITAELGRLCKAGA